MTLPNWYCLTGSKGPDMLVTQLPFRCWDITWACCASQGYWEGWISSGWGNTLEMVKGRVQSSWLWVPLSPDVSDIMSPLPSLSPWVFAPSLGGKRGDSGLQEAQSGEARAPVCPRPAARQGSTCCIPLSHHGPFSPSALYSVPRPPTWPPIRITEVIFLNYWHLGPSPKLLFNWSVLLGTHSF